MSQKQLVTRAQYARIRMLDKSSVQYAITSGKLSKSVVSTPDGIMLDVEIADQEWTPRSENTRDGLRPPGGDLPPGDAVTPIAVSKAKRESYAAEMARLELEQMQGTLVEAEEVEQRWIAVASLTRTKVLGIPSKTRQRIPELTDEQFDVIDQICREALEELSNENIDKESDEDLE